VIELISPARAQRNKPRNGGGGDNAGGDERGRERERAGGGHGGVGLRRLLARHEAPPGRLHRPGDGARSR